MGTISSGVDDINNIFRQKRLDDASIGLRQAQEARLDEQARAAKAKQDEIDRVNALHKTADSAGAKVFDGFRADHLLNGGEEGGYAPAPEHVAAAYRARGQEYIKAGDMTSFLKNHAEGAAMRAQVRAETVKEAMSSGDPASVMKALNGSVDNGIALSEIKPVSLPSQVPGSAGQAYQATYKLADGSTRTEMLTANDISKRAAYVLSNPGEVAKQELAYDLNRQKAEMTIREQNNKGAVDRETDAQKTANELGLESVKNKNRLGQIGAEGGEQRKTAGYKAGLDAAKPVNMGPGHELKAPVVQADGRIKYETVAKVGSNSKNLSAKDLNTMVINNYGLIDLNTGRQVGSDGTAKVSAAAEQLLASNPGLGANEAIVQAAKDLGLQIKEKN